MTITYLAPFDKCNREEDYRTDWAEFVRRGAAPELTYVECQATPLQ